MDPIPLLDSKRFILLDTIYERARQFLVEFIKTDIMYPSIHINYNCISLVWITTTLQIYEDSTLFFSKYIHQQYILPEQISILLSQLAIAVPYKRSYPIAILKSKRRSV